MTRNKKEVAFCQIDAQMLEKYAIKRDDNKTILALLKNRENNVSATMFISLVPLVPEFCHGYDNTKPAVMFFVFVWLLVELFDAPLLQSQ